MSRKRSGKTVKVSVSLDRQDLVTLKRLAKQSHDGNLSAAFAEAARWIRQREARRQLVTMLGGPTLTPESQKAIDAELDGQPSTRSRKSRTDAA